MKKPEAWMLALLAGVIAPLGLNASGAEPQPQSQQLRPSKVQSASPDRLGQTPLMVAALAGDTATVTALLGQDADVNATDKNGMTALMWAAPAVAPSLLASGADIHCRDQLGRTALHFVAFLGDSARVKTLLDRGLAVDSKDEWDQTPLFYAAEAVSPLAWSHTGQPSPRSDVRWAFADAGWPRGGTGGQQVVQLLIDRGANVNARDQAGCTPLLWATQSFFGGDGYWFLAQTLLAHGAKVNASDPSGKTALMWRARLGDARTVKLLLEHGADVNRTDYQGKTALTYAIERHHQAIVELLKQAGAKPSTPASAQGPFFDVPSNHREYEIINELAARGLVNGYRDGPFAGERYLFAGQRPLTRYEFAVMARRLAEHPDRLDFPRLKPPPKPGFHLPILSPPFPDVPKEHWARDVVEWVRKKGIVAGFSDGTYRGDRLMNRKEVSIATHRLCDYFVGLFGNEPGRRLKPLRFGSGARLDQPIRRYEFAVVLHQALALYLNVAEVPMSPES